MSMSVLPAWTFVHYMCVCAPYVCLTREVLELELQPVMSYCGYWEWKELGSPGRAASAANHQPEGVF